MGSDVLGNPRCLDGDALWAQKRGEPDPPMLVGCQATAPFHIWPPDTSSVSLRGRPRPSRIVIELTAAFLDTRKAPPTMTHLGELTCTVTALTPDGPQHDLGVQLQGLVLRYFASSAASFPGSDISMPSTGPGRLCQASACKCRVPSGALSVPFASAGRVSATRLISTLSTFQSWATRPASGRAESSRLRSPPTRSCATCEKG